jgi:hypothetical protein
VKSYYYSAALLLCGAVYSSFFLGGSSPAASASETPGQRDAASGSPAIGFEAKETAAKDGSTAQARSLQDCPPGLFKQLAQCEMKKAAPGVLSLECGLRNDIQNPRVIVATVPDPASTHLQLQFDRAIDGIEEAATDTGYFFRRYWLPWPAEVPLQFSDFASQEQARAERSKNRQFPGILLFENRNSESLAVLLVGESSTGGIDREQFRNALFLKDEIERKLASPPPLRILGTTFSGSLPSLRRALGDRKSAEVVSGTVTDGQSIADFNNAGLNLRTLTHDSAAALLGLLEYVSEKWDFSGPKVAIISESGTPLGSVFSEWKKLPFSLVSIRFPREIAHLRNAYERYPELSGSLQSTQSQRKTLPLGLDQREGASDSVPAFAPQTPVSQESTVLQIANRIRHENIRFAGILATDVLDALFISRFLRAATPDTRLFLLEPDLLFVHASDTLPFEGMLAVSTVPLLAGNPPFEPEVAGDRKPLVFPDPLQMGFYAALRELLGKPGGGFEVVGMGDKMPPLWITAVGRGGYIPIAVQPMEWVQNSKLIHGAALGNLRSRRLQAPPFVWWALFVLLTAAVGFFGLAIRLARRFASAWLADFKIPAAASGASERAESLTCVVVLATGLYLCVASTPVAALIQPQGRYSWWAWIATLMAAMATVFMVWVWWTAVRPSTPWSWFTAAAIAAVAAVFALLLYCGSTNLHLSGLFFQFRSLELAAGAPPVVPFLFLLGGFLAWAFVDWQRGIFHCERRPSVPSGVPDSTLAGNLRETAERVMGELHRPFSSDPGIGSLIAVLAAAATGATLFQCGLRSFENRFYDWLFISLASALTAMLMVNCWHLIRCWHRFTPVLQLLETHSLRKAFTALPIDHSWSPIWQSSPRKRIYLLVTRSIDVLHALRCAKPTWVSLSVWPLTETAAGTVRAILDEVAKGLRETPAQHEAAQRALGDVAEVLIADLQPMWSEGASETETSAIERKETEDAAKLDKPSFTARLPRIYAEEFVALRYVALIRYVMLQLRILFTGLSVSFMALAFSLMCYPFQGERLIGWFVAAVFAVLAAVVLVVFAQMDTDPTLSRITNTKSGQLGPQFLHRIASYGTLPLVATLASNFSGVGRVVFSWISPALKSLH